MSNIRGSRYWDGSPQQAWTVIANATAVLKRSPNLKGVLVGGPALISVMGGNQDVRLVPFHVTHMRFTF